MHLLRRSRTWYLVQYVSVQVFSFSYIFFFPPSPSAGLSPTPSVQTDGLGIAVRGRDGSSCVTRLGVAATVYTVRSAAAAVPVGIGRGRVPRGFDHLVRGRRAVFALLQRHDELRDLYEHAYQGQADALEREYVAYESHHGADHHFDVAQTHVHHFHFVLVAAAAAPFFTATCKKKKKKKTSTLV